MKKWQKETLDTVVEDLSKLREENIDTIRNIANDIANTFEDVKCEDIDECTEN